MGTPNGWKTATGESLAQPLQTQTRLQTVDFLSVALDDVHCLALADPRRAKRSEEAVLPPKATKQTHVQLLPPQNAGSVHSMDEKTSSLSVQMPWYSATAPSLPPLPLSLLFPLPPAAETHALPPATATAHTR